MATEEGDRRNLRLRLGVAAVGVPLCALVVYAGGAVFALGLGLVAGVGYWEYAAMHGPDAPRPFRWLGALGAGLFPIVVLYGGAEGAWILAALLLLATGAAGAAHVPVERGPVSAAALTAFGALYVGGLLSFGVPLREGRLHGVAELLSTERVAATLFFFYPVVVTWLADTAAYFGGRSLGRRRLAPEVSPNKTVEGAVAALAVGSVAALLYGSWVLPGSWSLAPLPALLFGLAVSGMAIGGDLVESALKREHEVKDASRLLPGHGGLLDRLDSLLWALPAAYFAFRLLGA